MMSAGFRTTVLYWQIKIFKEIEGCMYASTFHLNHVCHTIPVTFSIPVIRSKMVFFYGADDITRR